MTVRAATREDAASFVRIQNACFPEHPQALEEYVRDWDTLEPQYRVAAFVYESEVHEFSPESGLQASVWGYLSLNRNPASYHPQRFYFDLMVHPDARGRGIGTRLYTHLLACVAPLDPLFLHTTTREGEEPAGEMLERRGFVEVKRDFESVLELDSFDFVAFPDPRAHLENQGLTLTTLAALDSPKFRQKFHHFFSEVRLDIPRSAPPTPLEFGFFQTQVLEDPAFLPQAAFLALEGNDIVGYSNLGKALLPGQLEVWVTLVRREFRGRGIALALKRAGVHYALEHGFETIRTDNDTLNAAMWRVNEKLGYQRKPGWVHWMRTF